MTMPNERQLAIKNTRIFLLGLMDPKKTPRVPQAIRKEAYHCLKHYPSEYDMLEVSESLENHEATRPRCNWCTSSFTYSTNTTGPWSLDWYHERGLLKNVWMTVDTKELADLHQIDIGEKYLIVVASEHYAGGRIDIRGDTESLYGDEYDVRPMRIEDWNAFGDWLGTLDTTYQWSCPNLLRAFEDDTGITIRWAE
jgi:hypothetical protein